MHFNIEQADRGGRILVNDYFLCKKDAECVPLVA